MTIALDTQSLVTKNHDLIRAIVTSTLRKTGRRVSQSDYEDMSSEAAKALVISAARWHDYCLKNSYDSSDNEWFRIFATRRMKGEIINAWIKDSPLTRTEIDYSTNALRNGIPATMKKFSVTESKVKSALSRRELLLNEQSLSTHLDSDDDQGPDLSSTIQVQQPYNLWEVLHHHVDQLPVVAKVWLALVFVHNVPVAEARRMVGLTDIATAAALQGYLEYVLIHAVLQEREGAELE